MTMTTTNDDNDEDVHRNFRVIVLSFIIFLMVVKLVLRASCAVNKAQSVRSIEEIREVISYRALLIIYYFHTCRININYVVK